MRKSFKESKEEESLPRVWVVRRTAALTPNEIHDFMLTLTWNGGI